MSQTIVQTMAVIVFALMIVGNLRAEDIPANKDFWPPAMVAARQEYDAVIKKSDAEFFRVQIAAKQKYVIAIDNALKSATRAGNLDAANALNDEKKVVEQEINDLKVAQANSEHVGLVHAPAKEAPTAVPTAVHAKEPGGLSIDAKQGWQSVVHLKRGQVIHLKAEGTWRTYHPDDFACDAEGIRNGKETYPFVKTALPGALIGKFGNTVFLVGKACRIVAPDDGDLEVRINKRDDFLHDDSGQMTLTLRFGDTGLVDKTEHQAK
jgi:hypothetical protein